MAGPVQPGTGVQELGCTVQACVGAGAVQLATEAQVLTHAPELHVSPAGQSALVPQRQTPGFPVQNWVPVHVPGPGPPAQPVKQNPLLQT